jgi:hypothetical protein
MKGIMSNWSAPVSDENWEGTFSDIINSEMSTHDKIMITLLSPHIRESNTRQNLCKKFAEHVSHIIPDGHSADEISKMAIVDAVLVFGLPAWNAAKAATLSTHENADPIVVSTMASRAVFLSAYKPENGLSTKTNPAYECEESEKAWQLRETASSFGF